MGTGSSKNPDCSSTHGSDDRDDQGGGQLYVALKMEENSYHLKSVLIPHVYGFVLLDDLWDPSKAVSPPHILSISNS